MTTETEAGAMLLHAKEYEGWKVNNCSQEETINDSTQNLIQGA